MADALSIANQFVESYNAGDDEAMLGLCAYDIAVVHHNREIVVTGREAFAGLLGAFKAAFPDKRFVDRRTALADGDTAIICHTWTGTATADVPGFAAAGEVARLELATFYTVRDGLIVEYHDYG
jgi:steroid delta-isomerase-like uncharacterized protein